MASQGAEPDEEGAGSGTENCHFVAPSLTPDSSRPSSLIGGSKDSSHWREGGNWIQF